MSGELVREVPVRSHYVDFRDCVETADGLASWTGGAEYPDSSSGIALLDMATGDIKHEAPVTALSPAGRVVTFDATHLEVVGDRLWMYAIPDDGSSSKPRCETSRTVRRAVPRPPGPTWRSRKPRRHSGRSRSGSTPSPSTRRRGSTHRARPENTATGFRSCGFWTSAPATASTPSWRKPAAPNTPSPWTTSNWDIDTVGCAGVRATSGLLGSPVQYLKADALALVFCCGMLHRVENPLATPQALRRLLNPGGRLLLETYGVPAGQLDAPVIQVLAAGEANTGDDVHYWGSDPHVLTRMAGWPRLVETGDTTETTTAGHPRIIATLSTA